MRNVDETEIKASVIVPVKGRSRSLKRCISSILDQTVLDYNVLIIDGSNSGSARKVVRMFQRKDPRVKYLREEFFSTGDLINRGIMVSDGDIIIMTKPDCEVPRDWISRMIKPLSKSSKVVQGGIAVSSGKFWSQMDSRSTSRFMDRLSEGNFIDHLDTRNMAARREALIDAGMFDRYVRGLEGLDIELKLKRYGHQVRYLADVKVFQNIDESLNDLFWGWVERGRWMLFIYSMQKKNDPVKELRVFDALKFRNLLLFYPSLLLLLVTKGPKTFISELVSGTALRMGVLIGHIRKDRFLRSIRTKYY
ncbi:MAG: glycosyltransferase [Thermoplasmatota archaeon]